MWTIYKTGHYNIQYYVINLAENNLWIRLKNIFIIFALTVDSLPGGGGGGDDDDDDDDDNDTGDMLTCDIEATDDEVAEIFRKQLTW